MIDVSAADELLTTTRAVRRRLDLEREVPRELIRECIAIAQQAPTGGNGQDWRFVVVTDPDVRAKLAHLYRESAEDYLRQGRAEATTAQNVRVFDSATYLAEVLHRVPVLVVPCIRGRASPDSVGEAAGLYGSIIPAAWSFMLAARARGLGSVWTTLHLEREQEAARLLMLPDDVTQAAMIPLAYYRGTSFRPASRPGPDSVIGWNGWT